METSELLDCCQDWKRLTYVNTLPPHCLALHRNAARGRFLPPLTSLPPIPPPSPRDNKQVQRDTGRHQSAAGGHGAQVEATEAVAGHPSRVLEVAQQGLARGQQGRVLKV